MNLVIKAIDSPNPDVAFYKYAWVIYAAWLLFGLGHLAFVNDEHIPVKIVMPLILLGKSIYTLYAGKKKIRDLIIDDVCIEGVFEGSETREKVYWKEIRSARFEDTFIIFYGESSISRSIELDLFEENDQKIIVHEILKVVKERNIEFFNASQAALR